MPKIGDIFKFKYFGVWFKIKVIDIIDQVITFETLEPMTSINYYQSNKITVDFEKGSYWREDINVVMNDNRYIKYKEPKSHLPKWF